MKFQLIAAAMLAASLYLMPSQAWAREKVAIEAMEACLDLVDYGDATIFAEQIPKEDWQKSSS